MVALQSAQGRLEQHRLNFEGGKPSRQADGWVTGGGSADADSRAFMTTLRDRSRDLARNNPYATMAKAVKSAHTIGTGITGELSSKNAQRYWDGFVANCDADRHTDLNGLLALAEGTRFESGESLMVFIRGAGDPRENPISSSIRVLEPDFLDNSRDTQGGISDGRFIRDGIEYNSLGQAVAYWLFPEHPGDFYTSPTFESQRIPARDVIHIFRKLRPGQARGWSDLASVILRMRAIDQYDEAEQMRKQIEACLAVFVTSPAGSDASKLGPVSTDSKGRAETLYPGMIEYTGAGEDIRIAEPTASGGYADFQRFGLRAIAAGTGIPYALLTGDLTQVNYSSSRIGLVDFRKRIEQEQWLLWVPRVCERIAQRFKEELSELRPGSGARGAEFDWTPPRFELIDPMKETQADLEAVLAGFETWPEIVRRRGWNADQQLEVIERWQNDLEKRGIVLKSNAATSVTSAAEPRAPEDAEGEEEESGS